jgi:soluble cytochrome b562
MSDEEHEEGGFWSRITSINRMECEQCGHDNSRGATVCEECNTPLPAEEEDEESYSTVIGEGLMTAGKYKKVTLQEASNLKKLRECLKGAESGAMSHDEYRHTVKKIFNAIDNIIKFAKTEGMKKKIAALPPEEVDLVRETQQEFEFYKEGLSIMLMFLDEGNPVFAREGFAKAEEALVRMDRIQDKIIAMD